MIHTLKNIFPSFTFYDDLDEKERLKYIWFMTEQEEIIGILKGHLSSKELAILQTFLRPYEIQFPPLTEKEKRWKAYIENESVVPNITQSFRFVAFSFKRNQISPSQFKNALCELFAYEVPILWTNECEGIIIEEIEGVEEGTSYKQIIDILMSDLYVKIKFLVGSFSGNIESAPREYVFIQRAANIVFQYANENVLSYIDAVPYYLIYEKDAGRQQNLREIILRELDHDEEVLKMIEAFIDSNLNLSETAKLLHLHRNSLQYRIDRLHEKVGIDIRNFRHAMALYLILLVKK